MHASGFVLETLSSADVLINFAGDVKICSIENCKRSGDTAKLSDSLSRLTMGLMDKEKAKTAPIGLTHPDKWSSEAIDFFTMTTSSDIRYLLAHEFMQRGNQKELVWLVPFVLISASHSRE